MSADPPPATLRAALRTLKTTHHSLNPTHIPITLGAPSPLTLLRLAHQNTPHIFRGAFGDTAACEKWDLPYLKQAMAGREVEVAETPLGNADSVITHNGEDIFIKPHVTKMRMEQLLDTLVTPAEDGRVRYSQGQDNNLAHEFFPLSLDVPSSLPWADEAFDAEPDAGNIWIGESRSVSALHKDNYENLYCMVLGRKTFALVSPVSVGAVGERSLRTATYVPAGKGLGVRMDDDDEGWVHGWPTVDPDTPGVEGTEEEREGGEGLTVLRGTLEKGDVLYLPALWYHKVSQEVGEEGVCVAVNYWYDMDYAGTFYPMMQFVRDAERVAAKQEEKAAEGAERIVE